MKIPPGRLGVLAFRAVFHFYFKKCKALSGQNGLQGFGQHILLGLGFG